MKAESRIRFETAKDFDLIRKAAKLEKRSMNQFMAMACVAAAKATIAAPPKFAPSAASVQEASA
jgi:uncharacterized protein (DUF1778 family)